MQALAKLLDSCGRTDEFTDYAARADVRLRANNMINNATVAAQAKQVLNSGKTRTPKK